MSSLQASEMLKLAARQLAARVAKPVCCQEASQQPSPWGSNAPSKGGHVAGVVFYVGKGFLKKSVRVALFFSRIVCFIYCMEIFIEILCLYLYLQLICCHCQLGIIRRTSANKKGRHSKGQKPSAFSIFTVLHADTWKLFGMIFWI